MTGAPCTASVSSILPVCSAESVVATGARVGGAKFCVEGKFGECRGCRRLNNQVVTKDFLTAIPPIDCTREACALGLKPYVEPSRPLVKG